VNRLLRDAAAVEGDNGDEGERIQRSQGLFDAVAEYTAIVESTVRHEAKWGLDLRIFGVNYYLIDSC
jgi:hypothetical protein